MTNELRRDVISGGWVVIATGRARRPHAAKRERLEQPREECLFEPARLELHGVPRIVYDHGRVMPWHGDWLGRWTTVVVPNDFPALHWGATVQKDTHGPFEIVSAAGFHDVVITRDHDRELAAFTDDELTEVLSVYRDRSRQLSEEPSVAYINVCHNQGRAAGASIAHNHSQILTLPIVPPHVERSMAGARAYTDLIAWEIAEGKRVVYQNDHCIVLCPFASRSSYEMRIFPNVQAAQFHAADADTLRGCAEALGIALRAMVAVADHPDFNLYIHTAPVMSVEGSDAYWWHIEIAPRLTIAAGFELATSVFINPVDPDDAATQLKSAQ